MAFGQIDPARLEGDDLRRWYMRSPADIEQERQKAAAQRYQDFFGAGPDEPEPDIDDEPPAYGQDSDLGLRAARDRPQQNGYPGFARVPAGSSGLESVPISSGQGDYRSLGAGDFGEAPPFASDYRNVRARDRSMLVRLSAAAPHPSSGAPSFNLPAPPAGPPSPSVGARSSGFQSPFDMARDAFHNFRDGPRIPRPNLAESFIPVVGPAWEATADLQDGNYAGAAFNGAMAVADALPLGVAAKGLSAARKGIGILKKGSVTADAARKVLRRAGMATPGQEIHHTVPLNGIGRNVQDWRNHFAFLKPLPQEIHRRLTGSWMGKPEFDPIRKIWYGTTDWQKAVPIGMAGYAADAWENLKHPFGPPADGDLQP